MPVVNLLRHHLLLHIKQEQWNGLSPNPILCVSTLLNLWSAKVEGLYIAWKGREEGMEMKLSESTRTFCQLRIEKMKSIMSGFRLNLPFSKLANKYPAFLLLLLRRTRGGRRPSGYAVGLVGGWDCLEQFKVTSYSERPEHISPERDYKRGE